MKEIISLCEGSYKSMLIEGVKSFFTFYILNSLEANSIMIGKNELKTIVLEVLKENENEQFEVLLILILNKIEKIYDEENFSHVRKGIVFLLAINQKMSDRYGNEIQFSILKKANMIRNNYLLNYKVLDYFDNQLFLKILDMCYEFISDILNFSINFFKEKKILITSKTYEILYSDIEEGKRYNAFASDINAWILANNMDEMFQVVKEDKKIYIVLKIL